MAGLISGAMIAGGAVVVAPDASADERITSTYSSLPNDKYAEALRFNTEQIKMLTNQNDYQAMLKTWMQVTPMGPGWCIDLEKPQPNLDTKGYELRKLDGMSGLYGFNGFNGDLGINADIETAAISLTKSMLKSWYERNFEDVTKKNVALQALLSNNKSVLDGQRSYILSNQKQNGVQVTHHEFTQWTGFRISAVFGGNDAFQPNYALVKDEAAFSRVSSTVRDGEYVTILLPKDYNIYQDGREATFQRLIPPTQPGLDGFYPRPGGGNGGGTVTTTVTAPGEAGVTSTVTEYGTPTVTHTVYEHAGFEYETVTERPTVTVTNERHEVHYKTKTETPAPVTQTEHANAPAVTVTEFENAPKSTVTETVTQDPDVVVIEKQTPVTVTETATVRPTITETDKVQPKVTVTEPTYVTETKTAPAKTETKTVTAAPKTETKVVDTTVTRVSETRKTTEIERHFYKYSYVYDFSNKSESKVIEPNKSGNWKIEFVDDSNGLVDVKKENNRLVITPKKQGEGDVRIVITDGDGNRYEYTIHVVNKDSNKTTEKTVRVNNHFFNVSVTGLDQSITIPKGWKYEVTEGKNLVTTTENGDTLNVNVNSGVITGKVKVKVFEVDKDGNPTGNEENYEFNVDTKPNKYNQSRVIGNVSSYKIEVDNIQGEPEILKGQDLIESLEKKGDQWVLTPKAGKTGEVIIRTQNDKGETFVFTLDVRDGRNVLVDSDTKIISVGGSLTIKGEKGDKLEIVKGQELIDASQLQGDGEWTLKPSDDGLVVAHVKDANGQLVGVYTIVVTPQEAKPTKQFVETEISNRRTLILTKGLASNEFEFPDGTDNFTLVKDENDTTNTKYFLMPNSDFVGEFRVIEKSQGGHELIEYKINVTEAEVDEVEDKLPEGSTMTIPSVKKNQRIVVLAGADLLNSEVKEQGGQQLSPKPGVSGKVVIEIQNSRGLPIKRFTYNVTPNEPNSSTFEITSDDKFTTNVNPGDTVKIVKGKDLADLSNNGDEWSVTPKDGAEGEVVVEVTDKDGRVYQKFILNITKGKGGSSSSDKFERSYTITEKGTFDVTIVNNNKYEIVEGKEHVEIVEDSEGRYILRMKEGSKGNKVVVVEKDNSGNVVKKHNITITEDSGALKFIEERRVYQPKLTDKIVPGEGKNTFRVLRGEDIIEEIPATPGSFTLKPLPGKSGRVQIEELDHAGNPVRVLDIDVPATSEGNIIVKPGNSDVSPNPDGSWKIVIPEGGKISDIKVCEGPNNCKPVDPNMIEKNPDGSITIKPGEGGITPGTTHIYFTPWINGQKQDEVRVNVVLKNKAASSSDGKCIASLVGIASPLLLLIPLGILSQVRVPGLEGVQGKLNAAVREANDRIQRGLGIYDRDRAERAAGLQGAFSVVNPEMVGLAAGALGTITAGLLIVDAVLRSCGQGDKTSSYQIGKATGNDTLVYGSSKKDDAVRTATPVPPTEATATATPQK